MIAQTTDKCINKSKSNKDKSYFHIFIYYIVFNNVHFPFSFQVITLVLK